MPYKLLARTYGVMVSTLDFESNNPSSILGMSFFIHFIKPFFYQHTILLINNMIFFKINLGLFYQFNDLITTQ